MLELKIKQGRKHVPLFDLPAYLGRDEARREISDTVEGLIMFLDELGGDPDFEESDAEDSFALSWMAQYNSQGAGCPVSDPGSGYGEDDEDDDPAEDSDNDTCLASEDIGTDHRATKKMGWDSTLGGDEDVEENGDREGVLDPYH